MTDADHVMRLFFGFMVLHLLAMTPLYASPGIVLNQGQDDYNIIPKVEVLEDTSRAMVFQNVKGSEKFKPVKHLNFGLTTSAYWIRFRVIVPENYNHNLFLIIANPAIDSIEIFIPDGNEYVSKRYGDRLPFNKRDRPFNLFTVRLSDTPGSHTYYIRVENESWLIVPLFITTGGGFDSLLKTTNLIDGIFYGALFIMFLYYLLISIATRNSMYFFFSMFILASLLAEFTASGHGPEYLTPGVVWPKNAYLFLEFIMIALFTLFFRSYVFTGTLASTGTERVVRSAGALFFVGAVFTAILPLPLMERVFSIATIFLFIILMVGLFNAMRVRKRQAYYFAFAISTMIAGTMIFYSLWGGLLPLNFFTRMAYPAGFILMLALFSLGLADKVNAITNENLRLMMIEKEKAIIDKEIEMARVIQDHLLPRNLPDIPQVALAYTYIPMRAIGGDFVDIHYDEGRDLVGLFICDVAGHGVYAALLASMTKMALAVWREQLDNPREALNEIRHKLLESIGENFITACICSFNHATGDLKISNAGHPPAAIIRSDGTVELIKAKGRAITSFFHPDFREKQTRLHHGDTLILYTDGLTEADNGVNGMIGHDDRVFCEWLRKYSDSSLTPDEICSRIYKDALHYTGRSELDDDFTVIVMRHHEQ